ncbi:RNA ligase-domain-containing protein [Geopyxis carbonaria]|nr:RNA ligase-domain-containing protein [Geopyxis carbonaria]
MSSNSTLNRPRPTQEINELIETLNKGAANKGPEKDRDLFSVKKSTFQVDNSDHTVEGWKFSEHHFKGKVELPTYARGLFTYLDKESGDNMIVVRGYDKFFNNGEIPRTKWPAIEENTKGPYELTVKENGCIIFISGLPDGTLLVCSKHSTGTRGDASLSHAKVGEKWIDRHLAAVGKTRAQLADVLFKANVTAVAELCDDSFEEHILAYSEEKSGLYIHGINLNLPKFATYPMSEVAKFADDWGFHKVDYFLKDDVASLRKFLEEAAETGSWDGKDVEGFVIRCKARNGPDDTEWHDWFFKYKFEEPYLLYRQWRECTKSQNAGKEPRYKKHIEITAEYLKFADEYFQKYPEAKAQYNSNHGIIKLRNEFLQHRGLNGSDIIKQSAEEETEVSGNVVLVPVATLGCGKTTIALALQHMFGWGHKQNDNITGKRGKTMAFAVECAAELRNKPVVFADRNNHVMRERRQIIDDISLTCRKARFVALHYIHYDETDGSLGAKIRATTQNRVLSRGDNHQTIHAASDDKKKIIGIMEGFMGRFEPIDLDSAIDKGFDLVIDLDPTVDSRQNLETVVKGLRAAYPLLIPEEPTAAQYDDAIKAALEYVPTIKHTIGSPGSNTTQQPQKKPNTMISQDIRNEEGFKDVPRDRSKDIEYISISLPTSQVLDAVKETFASLSEQQRAFFEELQKTNRVQSKFHVTLIHRANAKESKAIWDRYVNIYHEKGPGKSLGVAKVRLETVVWDSRLMAISASILDSEQWQCVNKFPHVTIGTKDSSVKPKESNDLLTLRKDAQEAPMVGGLLELEGTVQVIKPNARG